ncbi:MAG: 6-phosphofructokinase [Bacteroidetes bacterium]|nr:6-phosphofructokinase [Bacteroidota bacterium]
MNSILSRIAVVTTGGDCPGLNAAIRAVVRTSIHHGLEIKGIVHGYDGLISGDLIDLKNESVSNIIQRGGTILKTSRSDRFKTDEGMKLAAEQVKSNNIDALVVIGGDGSFRGAEKFSSIHGINVMCIPKTIDNDIFGTDQSIGFDTAVNTVVQAVDKIRDTAASHDRLFFVEVMGRDSGMIALTSGIAVGAEAILIPETDTRVEQLVKILERGWQRKKTSMIVIVAEGDDAGGAYAIAEEVKKRFTGFDTRVSILGHMQRGGSPTSADRVLASRLGFAVIEGLVEGRKNEMVGVINNQIHFTPLSEVVNNRKLIDRSLVTIAHMLSQ